jgi:hypothetical protein
VIRRVPRTGLDALISRPLDDEDKLARPAFEGFGQKQKIATVEEIAGQGIELEAIMGLRVTSAGSASFSEKCR